MELAVDTNGLRAESLKLSQAQFVSALGTGQSIVNKRETSKTINNRVPEYPPYDVLRRDLCVIGQAIWYARELAQRA